MEDLGLIPELGRCPGEGKGYPLQYSSLENSRDYTVHGITKNQTQLSDFHFHHDFRNFAYSRPKPISAFLKIKFQGIEDRWLRKEQKYILLLLEGGKYLVKEKKIWGCQECHGIGRGIVLTNTSMSRVGFLEKATLEQRLKGGEVVSLADVKGKRVPDRARSQAEARDRNLTGSQGSKVEEGRGWRERELVGKERRRLCEAFGSWPV